VRDSKSKGTYVDNLTLKYVDTEDELLKWIEFGNWNRKICCTNMNADSSRSHIIVQVIIGQENNKTGTKNEGKLLMVDLAGSEFVSKTCSTGMHLDES